MKSIISTLIVLATISIMSASTIHAQDNMKGIKPNIVYILVDNWGWGDLSIQGSTISTPKIDTLAAEGIRLTNFNVQNQCTPTRSALHTGRLPIRSGTQKVPAPGEPDGLAPWEYTIAELLSDAGYATALNGKWHIGSKVGYMPNDQGYDEWWGINEGSRRRAIPALLNSIQRSPRYRISGKGLKENLPRRSEFSIKKPRTLWTEKQLRELLRLSTRMRKQANHSSPMLVLPTFILHGEFILAL